MSVVPIRQVRPKHVTVEIIGWPQAGKSNIGRIIALALRSYGVTVEVAGKRAVDGITTDGIIRPTDEGLEPQTVTIWELDTTENTPTLEQMLFCQRLKG